MLALRVASPFATASGAYLLYGDRRRYPNNRGLELAMRTAVPLFAGVGTAGLVCSSLSAKLSGSMFLLLAALGPVVAARAQFSPPYNAETLNRAMIARAKRNTAASVGS